MAIHEHFQRMHAHTTMDHARRPAPIIAPLIALAGGGFALYKYSLLLFGAPVPLSDGVIVHGIYSHRPSTDKTLKGVEGVSGIWLKQHGTSFLKKIVEFCSQKEKLPMDMPPMVVKPPENVTVCTWLL